MSDFTTGATLTATTSEAFSAILDTRAWWNEAIEGPTAAVGDEFGFEVEGLHRTRIRVTDVTPNQRVEWLVLDNEFGFIRDQNEWVGDRIVFEVEPIDGGTRVTFTQHGLVPELECYEVCSNAWVFFIQDSLRKLAEHGKGSPETNAGQAAPAGRARDAVAALGREE